MVLLTTTCKLVEGRSAAVLVELPRLNKNVLDKHCEMKWYRPGLAAMYRMLLDSRIASTENLSIRA